ncbi:MAG: uncharacterized protein KVP18_003724 [Porospora cf. gigantea A]|uniref:uncharacterized protein n=2 Tax=Porospora cf. gigantea A TaxID=2853593 RepID=UPI003559B2A9|nr:MAG: hypothetical protein KVP18_003724 [Porospora cf. gigantea A]
MPTKPLVAVPRTTPLEVEPEPAQDDEEVEPWLCLSGEAPFKYGVIVQALVQRIETILDEYKEELDSGVCVLEVEGRLGSLMSGDERIRLPVESEVLLSSLDTDELSYRFNAGVSQHQYAVLTDHLKRILGITATKTAKGVKKDPRLCQVELMQTNDYFCPVEENGITKDIRVSYLPNEKEPLEAIRKDRLIRMDVYTGCEQHTEDEQQNTTVVDFRLAVNLEYRENAPPLSKTRPDRSRQRQSFPLFGFYRLDLTEVLQDSYTHYEIEMEINPAVLRQEYNRRSRGKANSLYAVVDSFVANLRGMSAFLNNKNEAGQATLNSSDLRSCSQAQHLSSYLQRVSPIVPIIGDYLFRAVSYDLKERGAPELSVEDIAESRKTKLTEAEILEVTARQQNV